jgi:hypothetical protein
MNDCIAPRQHIGVLQVLVVLQRQPVEGEGLAKVLFHPFAELRILISSALQPLRQVFRLFLQNSWHLTQILMILGLGVGDSVGGKINKG